jgi:hypothetical protein
MTGLLKIRMIAVSKVIQDESVDVDASEEMKAMRHNIAMISAVEVLPCSNSGISMGWIRSNVGIDGCNFC